MPVPPQPSNARRRLRLPARTLRRPRVDDIENVILLVRIPVMIAIAPATDASLQGGLYRIADRSLIVTVIRVKNPAITPPEP